MHQGLMRSLGQGLHDLAVPVNIITDTPRGVFINSLNISVQSSWQESYVGWDHYQKEYFGALQVPEWMSGGRGYLYRRAKGNGRQFLKHTYFLAQQLRFTNWSRLLRCLSDKHLLPRLMTQFDPLHQHGQTREPTPAGCHTCVCVSTINPSANAIKNYILKIRARTSMKNCTEMHIRSPRALASWL